MIRCKGYYMSACITSDITSYVKHCPLFNFIFLSLLESCTIYCCSASTKLFRSQRTFSQTGSKSCPGNEVASSCIDVYTYSFPNSIAELQSLYCKFFNNMEIAIMSHVIRTLTRSSGQQKETAVTNSTSTVVLYVI